MAHELETRHLRQVATLARTGSFASAARSLGLSQPALSRSIQAVERELGAPLFDRHPRGVTPTPLGEVLVARAEQVLAQVADLRREIDLMRGVGSGVLRIGAGPAMRPVILPRVLGRLCHQHPRLSVDVTLGDWRALSRGLLDRDLDLILVERSEAEHDERFEIQPLPSENGKWFVRADHPLLARARQRPLPLSALGAYTLGLPSLPPRLGPLLRPLLGGRSGGPAAVITCDEFLVLRALALGGDVVVLLTPSVAQQDLDQERLVVLPVRAKLPSTRPGAIWLRGRSLSPAAEAFLEGLR